MEVFKVFATLSLVDMLSGPLGKIRQAMGSVDTATKSLHARMGQLALAMGPLALGAGVLLGSFGACVSTAAAFEDQIAKVGAVSRASGAELKALEDKARELGASTQFTAVQVGQAEQYLAMAGFSVQENIAALPGVLNLAAATATDLGRAADISSDILGAFGMKAAEMGRVADVLAMTCSTANTNMELLGDTMKYVAPVARTAGLSIEETAAMAGLLGNVGIKGSQAGTTLKAMLNKMAAPAKEAQKVFQKFGITVKDQAGNLRSPIQLLGEMSGKLKKLGTAEQMAAMKAIVGEEAIAGFAELIEKGGIGELEKYIKKIQEAGDACDTMAGQMNNTLAGSVRGMGSAWESVQISIGKLFLPIVRKVVDAITGLLRLLDAFAQSKVGSAILKFAGALATAVVAVTAFAAGIWAVGKAAPLVSKFLLSLKTTLLGLGAPIWALIAVAGLFYAAWKTDFGGIATVLTRWWRNIKLVVNGVIAIFNNLKGSSSEIRGELARDIKAAGLEGLVVNVGKIVFRIREFFSGIWDGLKLDGAVKALEPAMNKVSALFSRIGELIGRVFGFEVRSASSEARSFGEVIGKILSLALEGLATVLSAVVAGVENLIAFVRMVCAIFTGDWAGAIEQAKTIWNNLVDTFMSFADLFRIGDWIREAWAEATEWLSSINLFESGAKLIGTLKEGILSAAAEQGRQIWDNFCAALMSFADLFRIGDWIREAWAEATEWLSSINLFESGAKLIDTLKEGILSAASGLVDSVKGVFQKVRTLLPFSDAKEGPLSTLTLSGSRLMTTLGEGVSAGFPSLMQTISGKFQTMKDGLGSVWQSLFGGEDAPELKAPKVPEAPGMPKDVAQDRQRDAAARAESQAHQSFTLHIANITLPNVKDANDFYDQLKSAAMEYGESMA